MLGKQESIYKLKLLFQMFSLYCQTSFFI